MPKIVETPFAPLVAIEAIEGRSSQERQVLGTIALPMRDHVNAQTLGSLIQTKWPEPTDKLINQGSVLTVQRNSMVQRMRGDWLLFIDDDMVWEPDAVQRMIDGWHELEEQGIHADVYGGLCFRRGAPFQPTLYMRQDNGKGPYNFLETWEPDSVVEVDATGMAFCLISVTAFEKIMGESFPPFDVRIADQRHPDFFRWFEAVGEDLRFCMDLKAAGGRIFVDTRVQTLHVGEFAIGYNDWLRWCQNRTREELEDRRKVNDAMGLPTLLPGVARDILGGRGGR